MASGNNNKLHCNKLAKINQLAKKFALYNSLQAITSMFVTNNNETNTKNVAIRYVLYQDNASLIYHTTKMTLWCATIVGGNTVTFNWNHFNANWNDRLKSVLLKNNAQISHFDIWYFVMIFNLTSKQFIYLSLNRKLVFIV